MNKSVPYGAFGNVPIWVRWGRATNYSPDAETLQLVDCKVTNFRPVPIFELLTSNWFIRTNFRTFEGRKNSSKEKKNYCTNFFFRGLKAQCRVSRQQCERQKCERHQCEARSANANSAKRQQCEWDNSAKVKCAKVRSANATLVRSDKTPKWFKSSEAAASAFRMEFFFLSLSLSVSLFLSRVIR